MAERADDAGGMEVPYRATKGATGGHGGPGTAGGRATILVYGHYDVQPAEPLEEWRHDPFGAEIVDGRIYARGAVDEKGGSLATLIARGSVSQGAGKPAREHAFCH